MYHCFTYNLFSLRNICQQSWKPLIKRELSFEDGKFSKLSSRLQSYFRTENYSAQNNSVKTIQQKVVLNPNLFDLLFGIRFNPIKNFSTSKALQLAFGTTNQDREKFNNYSFLAVLSFFIFCIVYMTLTEEHHQDYVFIEPEEPEGKK